MSSTFAGYLRAHENRRAFFREMGATSTDHGHPDAPSPPICRAAEAEALYDKVAARALSAPARPSCSAARC